MMQIVYFSHREQFLSEMSHLSGEKIYVAPSPAKADNLRTKLGNTLSSDVVTIAKFTGDLLKTLWSEENRPQVKRKAELLLIFGILKNKYFPDLGFEQFTQAYNLFSDLRSFTLNEEALTSVLDEQPEEIKNAVRLFWKLLEVTGYLDEHGAYQKISEALRSADEETILKKTYVFWGFQHLNGQQVDLLKALSIRYEVIIPFPLDLKDHLKRSDWISWIKDSKVKEVELKNELQKPKAAWLQINSREVSLHLKDLIKPHDQVLLGVSKLSPLHLDIVPSKNISFKIPIQLIQSELKELAVEIKDEMKEDVNSFLEMQKNKLISEPQISFKKLKAIELYQSALSDISQLTDDKIKNDSFFFKLLNDVVMLNQPRSSFVPLSSSDLNIDLKDMSSLEDLKRERRIIVCIDERFEDFQGLGQNYTESIQKSLASLGPLKRNELELLFKQWEFKDLFSHSEVLVLMSESTLKHSLVWKRLFDAIELHKIHKENVSNVIDRKDAFKQLEIKPFSGSFSASKFQTYLDCPRKFYFSYVDKIFPQVNLEQNFDSLTSGTISHRIIEVFYKRNLKEEDLTELTKEIMQEFIQAKKLELSRETYLKHELVFNHRSSNGIHFLKKIEACLDEKFTWKLEEEFNFKDGYDLRGKIDCVGISDKTILLLDFKSSKYSIASNKEVENFENLQLWAYAHAASKNINGFDKKTIILGFISLDNPQDSILLSADQESLDRIKISKISKSYSFKNSFTDTFKLAQEKMTSLSGAIQAEKSFFAKPRKSNTCHFCELTKVCIKNKATHE